MNQATYDKMTEVAVSEQQFDQSPGGGPSVRYVICSTQRSGSYLLCRQLINAGLGVPHEYFNPGHVTSLSQRWGLATGKEADAAYLRELYARRTTPNRVWGTKLQWHQLEQSRDLLDQELAQVDKYIFLYREDVAAQSVSLHLSFVTGCWGFDGTPTTPPAPNLRPDDLVHVARCSQIIQQDNAHWQEYFAQRHIQPLVIPYEAYATDQAGWLGRIASFLGVPDNAWRQVPPEPKEAAYDANLEAVRRSVIERFRNLQPHLSGAKSRSLEPVPSEPPPAPARARPREDRPTDHRFIFVGGLHRSGTSLMHECLRQHPSISGFHDTGVPEDEGQHLQTVYPTARAHGGPGRFGFDPAAHLVENASIATPTHRQRLMAAWQPYWDLSCPVLVEKSPPNFIRMRYLQALFPDALFVMMTRHPVPVSLATQKWSQTTPDSLLDHWRICHETFEADRPLIKNLMLIRYEDFVAAPQDTVNRIYRRAGLAEHACTVSVADANADYMERWRSLADPTGANARAAEALQSYAARFGYRLVPDPATLPWTGLG